MAVFPPCVYIFTRLSYTDMDLGPPLIQCELILTNYIGKDPIFKEGHILRVQVDINFGGIIFNPVWFSLLW